MAIPDAALEMERRKRLTRRVKVGAYYTDGRRLVEVVKVYELGHVIVQGMDEAFEGYGIDGFRAGWWLVREPGLEAA